MADPAVYVAHDPAWQRGVEEHRPVVGGHLSGQRQLDAETPGHELPSPGTAHRGQDRQPARCRQRPRVDGADAGVERITIVAQPTTGPGSQTLQIVKRNPDQKS